MWFFMYVCYGMNLISALLFVVAGVQRALGFHIGAANYPTFLLLCIIVYLFTQTLIMFFFVGTGVSIKEYTHEHNLCHEFHKKSIRIKRIIYPPQLMNILYVMLTGISLGLVARGYLPDWGHNLLFAWSMVHFVRLLTIEHQCFKENTRVILDMSGILHRI